MHDRRSEWIRMHINLKCLTAECGNHGHDRYDYCCSGVNIQADVILNGLNGDAWWPQAHSLLCLMLANEAVLGECGLWAGLS